VGHDLLDSRRLGDARDDPHELAAGRTREGVDFEELKQRPAIEVRPRMHHPIVTVGPDKRAQRAVHLMRSRKIGCLPVLEDQRPV